MDEKVDIKKINKTIDDMEEQVGKLKSVAEIYSRLEELSSKININKESMDSILKELEVAEDALSKSLHNNAQVIDDIMAAVKSMRKQLEEEVSSIRKESVQAIGAGLKEIESSLANSVDAIRKENKDNYKYLEELTTSKLDRNKSDLIVEIRESGFNTEKSVESKLNQGLINLDKNLNERFSLLENKLVQNFKDNRNLFYLILGVSIISVILNISILVTN